MPVSRARTWIGGKDGRRRPHNSVSVRAVHRLRLSPVSSATRDEPKAIEVITRSDTIWMPKPL
jgi:hypothetical protein